MTEQGVYGALAAAQAEFPSIGKSHTAVVQSDKGKYTYTYADLSDIMAAVRPVLAKHGLALMQPIEMLENGRLALRTSIVHRDGSGIHSMMHLPNMEGKPQAFGSSLTYARRYALSSLIGIATEEDDDGTAAQDPGPTERQSRQTRQPHKPLPPLPTPEAEVNRALGQAKPPTALVLRYWDGAEQGTYEAAGKWLSEYTKLFAETKKSEPSGVPDLVRENWKLLRLLHARMPEPFAKAMQDAMTHAPSDLLAEAA